MIIQLVSILSLFAYASGSPAPEPLPVPTHIGRSGSTEIISRVSSLLYVNVALGIGNLLGIREFLSIFTSVNIQAGLQAGLDIQNLITLEILISYLETLRGISGGYLVCLDLEVNIIRLLSIDTIISSCRQRNRFTSGLLILALNFDFGRLLNLNSLIGSSTCANAITSSISIGQLIEFGLGKGQSSCGSCGTTICLPRIIILETTVCRTRFPIDWWLGLGSYRRPNICPICS